MKKLFEAYKEILYSIFLIIASTVVIILFGFIFVTPLWIAATKYKYFYTIAFFTIITILFLHFLIIKIRKKHLEPKKIINFVFNFFLILLGAFLFLSAIMLANNGFYIHSIAIVVLIFLILGIIRSFSTRKNNNHESK